MFAAPPEQTLEWSDDGVSGATPLSAQDCGPWPTAHLEHWVPSRHVKDSDTLNDGQKDLRRKTHETINKVNDDYGRRNTFNTAIAAVMELLNEVG